MHVDQAATRDGALEHGFRGVDRALAADDAHEAPHGDGPRDLDVEHGARGRVRTGDRGQEAVGVVRGSELEQVARAHGFGEREARGARGAFEGGACGLGPSARRARGERDDLAHELPAIVGALVAHHRVAGVAVLVGGREVAVEAALELPSPGAAGGGVDVGPARRAQLVQGLTVGVRHGEHVIGRLHAPFELEGRRPGVDQARQHLARVGVARAEGAFPVGGREHATIRVDELIGQAARLSAHAAVGRAARAVEAREQADSRVAEADRSVCEDLEVDAHGRDRGDLVDRELARERHAVGAAIPAPRGSARVVDVGLRGDVRLELGHEAAHLGEEPPVLDDEGVGPADGAGADELERLGHLGVLDDDVHRDVDPRAGEMGLTAGGLERRGREVVGLATGVEGAHAAVDGVRSGREGRREGLGSPSGGEELGQASPRALRAIGRRREAPPRP